jgi:nitrite reductase/ring-hydroxylating ferredoxin subunit
MENHMPLLKLPIPASWYAVALADDLLPGGVLARTLANQELVVFRTRSGMACAMDAYCPHLGAHLGIGGQVESETIRCPFHGFCFDTTGTCVATGYGTKPPTSAHTRVWPVREVNGIVFVYYDAGGGVATWEPPMLEQDTWRPLIHATFDLHDHPQETVENSVDLGHFGIVHGYTNMTQRDPLQIDGHHFHIGYAAERPLPLLPRVALRMQFLFEIDIYGLGCSIVTITVERFGLKARLFVLATPTTSERITLSLALSLHEVRHPGRIFPLARLVPQALLEQMIARTILQNVVHDARQDFVIWEHKQHVQPPALAQGDGPIGPFRTWARQFYPNLSRAAQAPPSERAAAATAHNKRVGALK